jgi:hypothetical protein
MPWQHARGDWNGEWGNVRNRTNRVSALGVQTRPRCMVLSGPFRDSDSTTSSARTMILRTTNYNTGSQFLAIEGYK